MEEFPNIVIATRWINSLIQWLRGVVEDARVVSCPWNPRGVEASSVEWIHTMAKSFSVKYVLFLLSKIFLCFSSLVRSDNLLDNQSNLTS